MSGNGKKAAGTALQVVKKMIDWDAIDKAITQKEFRAEFMKLRNTYEETTRSIQSKLCMEEPEPIDWDYWRREIRSPLVDKYKEAFEGIQIPEFVDTVTPKFKPKLEESAARLRKVAEQCQNRAEKLEAEAEKIKEFGRKVQDMTVDEYFEMFPKVKEEIYEEIRNDNFG
nr:ATP synthase D chain subunit d [Viscum album]